MGRHDKNLLFSRGYKDCRKRLNDNPKYYMSCFNCIHYFKAHGDKEEMCQNNEVLEYDMIVEPQSNRVYCLKWKPTSSKTDLFHRNGRSVLD